MSAQRSPVVGESDEVNRVTPRRNKFSEKMMIKDGKIYL